ncbi:hypothetical protein V8F33_011854 [Rhypophila sp. PSN 637]
MFATAAAALGLLLVAPSTTYAYAVNTPPPDVAPGYQTVFNDPTAALNPKHNKLCYRNALAWLAEGPIPVHCTARVAHQASALCSSYLHVAQTTTTTTTVFKTTTITSETTATATQTSTFQTTQVVRTTLTTKTTSTSVFTTTTTSPTSTFTATIFTAPVPVESAFPLLVKARQAGYHHNQFECPAVSKKNLEYLLGLLHYACACLGIYPSDHTNKHTSTSTVELTSTITTIRPKFVTITTTTTTTTTSTTPITTSSTTTTTKTTTTTSPVVATTTAVVDYCDITYNGGGITPGNTILLPNSTLTDRECCITCFETLNCVASAVGLGYCQLLVKIQSLNGTSASDQCPLGIEDYPVEPGPGTLYLGPCGIGTNN